MSDLIRLIEKSDFDSLPNLFDFKKSTEELKWLFADPAHPGKYNAYVAIDARNEIVGVIGYRLSIYSDGVNEITGVIPMSWQIKSGYTGLAGILLFKKVVSLGEFGLAIAGSSVAQQLYPLFKYKYISNIPEFFKITKPIKTFFSLTNKKSLKSVVNLIYLLPSQFKKYNINNKTKLRLIPWSNENIDSKNDHFGIFKKRLSINEIEWFLSCPNVNSYAFNVYFNEDYIGVCILTVKSISNFLHGRIVHLPFTGSNEILLPSLIHECIIFFRQLGCCSIVAWENNPKNVSGLISNGFIKQKRKGIPVYVRDVNNTLSSERINNWMIQFSEGDKFYRNFLNF